MTALSRNRPENRIAPSVVAAIPLRFEVIVRIERYHPKNASALCRLLRDQDSRKHTQCVADFRRLGWTDVQCGAELLHELAIVAALTSHQFDRHLIAEG